MRGAFLGLLLAGTFASAGPGKLDPLRFARLPDGLQLVLELGGSPAGVVTLTRRGPHYTYRSQHFFVDGGDINERSREAHFTLGDGGTVPEGRVLSGLWLWRRPTAGCVEGLDELSGQTGTYCVEAEGEQLVGTMGQVRFRASYGPDGILSELVLPDSTLRRLPPGSELDTGPQSIVSLEEALRNPPGTGALRWKGTTFDANLSGLTPWTRQEAEALARAVDHSFRDKRQGPADFDASLLSETRGGCLAHARRFAVRAKKQGKVTGIVHGLVHHKGALRPHAWVRVALEGGKTLELDPALGKIVSPSTHLALGATVEGRSDPELGRRWLRVINGGVQVSRGL